MNLFYQPMAGEGANFLDEEESRHCIKVLRKRSGDAIVVTDGAGYFYEAVIAAADAQRCTFIVQKKTAQPKRNFSIHIAIAPTKQTERMEWFVEKSVELGVDSITFVESEHSERSYVRMERINRVMLSAMKQSLKAFITTIHPAIPIDQLMQSAVEEQKFIAHVDATNPVHLRDAIKKGSTYLVLIGPEGDFSHDELERADNTGFTRVSLGPGRLRTETAGMAACHILNLANT